MKTTTSNSVQKRGWLRAIADGAKAAGIPLPPFTAHQMGHARTEAVVGGRFITFKRRLIPIDQAQSEGIEWTLWQTRDELPCPVAAFRERLQPNPHDVAAALSLFKGWLVDQWSVDVAKAAVGMHPRVQAVAELAPPDKETNRDERTAGRTHA